jgi:hypothetical protein
VPYAESREQFGDDGFNSTEPDDSDLHPCEQPGMMVVLCVAGRDRAGARAKAEEIAARNGNPWTLLVRLR